VTARRLRKAGDPGAVSRRIDPGTSRGEGLWLAVLASVSVLALVALALALSGHLGLR
jgi:hypothetical protein